MVGSHASRMRAVTTLSLAAATVGEYSAPGTRNLDDVVLEDVKGALDVPLVQRNDFTVFQTVVVVYRAACLGYFCRHRSKGTNSVAAVLRGIWIKLHVVVALRPGHIAFQLRLRCKIVDKVAEDHVPQSAWQGNTRDDVLGVECALGCMTACAAVAQPGNEYGVGRKSWGDPVNDHVV